jgi:beta-mannosidase
MPGFCPPLRPVGPWRGVRLVLEGELAVEDVRLIATLDGKRGMLEARITCRLPAAITPVRAEIEVGESSRAALQLERVGSEHWSMCGTLVLEDVEPWWPHTHGEPRLYAARAVVALEGRSVAIELGRVGFRTIDRPAGPFALRLNGLSVYCRGACWTPLDVAALHVGKDAYRTALERVREGGMNMLRLSGNLNYESDAFYELCDELGILVWQDFMFANMDYPASDPSFMASCRTEAGQLLERTTGRACLAVLCGNSEVAQQAAMMGMPQETWHNELFAQLLPELCAGERPDVLYVRSSPSGGVMPFHTGEGPTHYYGVGAYLRPIGDARLRTIGFASECLAFSNVPEEESLRAWLGDDVVPSHHPRYKARVPRDPGVGWDFADVTDHYVEMLFGVEARRLRYSDHERYLELCRITTGEVMAQVQGLWRRSGSGCSGAIVWLLRDLWEGAGFGVIDSRGLPKAPYYFLKRAWAKVALWIVDEGTDGLRVHAANDSPKALVARLELALHRADGGVVERIERDVEVPAQGQLAFSVEHLIGRFIDSSYAYRFGPPVHALVAARLLDGTTGTEPRVLARAFHLPLGLAAEAQGDVGLTASARACADGSYALTVSAVRFAQSVHVQAPGYDPSDNYFHVAPDETYRLTLMPTAGAGALRGKLRALNAAKPATIRIDATAGAAEAPR